MDTSAVNPLSPESLILAFGLAGIFAVLYAETGLLIGFFLPGDSLLFIAGLAASDAGERAVGAHLPIAALLVGCPIAAVAGAQTGHFLGMAAGRKLIRNPRRGEAIEKAEDYFRRYGVAKALILARFIGVVRTFVNPASGMLNVPAKTFFVWNVVGALIWTDGLLLVGCLVGDRLPRGIDVYVLPIVLGIMVVSLLPPLFGALKAGLDQPGAHTLAECVRGRADRLTELKENLRTDTGPRRPVLTGDEARATAHLLDLLNEAHPDGPVGELTGDLSRRIVRRLRDSSAA